MGEFPSPLLPAPSRLAPWRDWEGLGGLGHIFPFGHIKDFSIEFLCLHAKEEMGDISSKFYTKYWRRL